MAKPVTNKAASIRQRLLNHSREHGRGFEAVLISYGLERLIYRLSISDHRDQFILKGGMLVTMWTFDQSRFTRDVDFLGHGDPDADTLIATFAEILGIECDDGLTFDAAALTAMDIRENQIYGGTRLKTVAHLGSAKIPITIDIGFGDAIADPGHTIDYPSLLDYPETTVRAYPPETVIAEKFQAVVVLGEANGRMKDFYDLWAIPDAMEIDQGRLANSIRATFERRETDIPDDRPAGLSEAFYNDASRQRQWAAYAESIDLEGVTLHDVVEKVWSDLEPVCQQLRHDQHH